MFVKRCTKRVAHPRHEHDHTWVRRPEEPEGWFPPGTYADMPEEWTVTYQCLGLEEDLPALETCPLCGGLYEDVRSLGAASAIAHLDKRHKGWRSTDEHSPELDGQSHSAEGRR